MGNQVLIGALAISLALVVTSVLGLFGNRFSTSPVYNSAEYVWRLDRLTGAVRQCGSKIIVCD
jgi:hypothetical protein